MQHACSFFFVLFFLSTQQKLVSTGLDCTKLDKARKSSIVATAEKKRLRRFSPLNCSQQYMHREVCLGSVREVSLLCACIYLQILNGTRVGRASVPYHHTCGTDAVPIDCCDARSSVVERISFFFSLSLSPGQGDTRTARRHATRQQGKERPKGAVMIIANTHTSREGDDHDFQSMSSLSLPCLRAKRLPYDLWLCPALARGPRSPVWTGYDSFICRFYHGDHCPDTTPSG